MLNYHDIAKIFEEIEIRLISSLKRNLGRHKNEEHQHGFKWSAWQTEKLRNIDKFRQENSRIMNSYTNVIDSATRQIMLDEFSQGMNGVNTAIPENIPDTPAEITREPDFFGVDKTKVDKLVDDVVTLEKHAETAVLRTMDDVYRQTVNKAQLAMSTGSMTLQKAIDMSVQDFLSKGINCIVYRNGRRVNVADYVRMALRTTATRATLYGISAKIRQLGYDTVLVSSYGMCSETCLPWQGRPYIDDVFSLWDGEIHERSNGELWGKSHYCGKWFPLLSTALHGGLFHPNCRHTITMWRDGDSLPEPQNNSKIQRRYRLEQHQRQLENKIRKAKRFVEGQSDPDNVKKAKKLLRDAQKELREFIANTNLSEGAVILKRDYGKEKIYTANSQNGLTSALNNGTMKNIQLPYETDEIRSMSKETKRIISETFDKIKAEYNVEIDELVTEPLKETERNVPFQFQPVRGEDGELIKRIVINSNYDFMGTHEQFQARILRNFNKKVLASNSVAGLIAHELAHVMTFQDISTFSGYLFENKSVSRKMVYGISLYADSSGDGAECIAEAFAAKWCGLPISPEAQELLDEFIERWRK